MKKKKNENTNIEEKTLEKIESTDEQVMEKVSDSSESTKEPIDSSEESQEENVSDIIEELKAENESLREQLLRKTADFENFRKRQERILSTMIEQERNNIIGRLLDVADDVERAMQEVENEKDPASIYNGIKLVSKKIKELLRLEGVESEDPTGKKFDPLEHDAIAVQPVDSPDKDGIIIQTIQPGYTRQRKLVRPARVIVGKYSEAEKTEQNENNEDGEK